MKLGMIVGNAMSHVQIDMDLVLAAERLGFDSVWTSEAWGADAVTAATWILAQTSKINVGTAIIQIPARTPATAAMTAMSLQQLSGGRFILGVGPSGPQVIEGWHGVPYGRPLERTREYIEIIRKVLKRDAPLTHEGRHYQIPATGEGTTGLGKPLKSILHADPTLKIITGAISPAGIRTAAEVADGFVPAFMNPERFDLFESAIQEGFAKVGGGKSMADFAVMPFCTVNMLDDMEQARRPEREHLALYVGGMGARDKNFYNDYVKRMGYEDAAVEIQDHFLAGRRTEAMLAVPEQLVDEVSLVGPKGKIVEHLQDYMRASKAGKIDSLLCHMNTVAEAEVLAETVL